MGGGLALGLGVATNGLALPGFLARAVSRLTGRGAEVRLIADARMTARNARPRIEEAEPASFDAVLFTLGVNEAFTLLSRGKWRRRLAALLHEARLFSRDSTGLFVLGTGTDGSDGRSPVGPDGSNPAPSAMR